MISNEKSKLLISGSYLLKANTPDSDFDCLVVVPNNGNINNYFYGNSECNLKEKNCFDRSLFCIFCLHSKTNSIAKISGRVPLIKINFMEAEFDLLLVSLPKNSFNKLFALNEPKIEKVDEAIATYILERIGGIEAKNNGQLWPLSGYRANLRLYELTVNSRKTYTMLLQTIKYWTKSNLFFSKVKVSVAAPRPPILYAHPCASKMCGQMAKTTTRTPKALPRQNPKLDTPALEGLDCYFIFI
ncbi:unnamed protein product [Meloidogyne enterolobii]|uniref:Uncharacterized protein n=1 Tax=Meloidogyne enterolobii TaxID=390850 RepID=A0ACB0YIJ7_MELEN